MGLQTGRGPKAREPLQPSRFRRPRASSAKATGDDSQMVVLDFAYRREHLYFEILLDVRDAIERNNR